MSTRAASRTVNLHGSWIDLDCPDLSAGQPVHPLTRTGGQTYAGNTVHLFKSVQAFTVLPAGK
jgi:hypothetical protein